MPTSSTQPGANPEFPALPSTFDVIIVGSGAAGLYGALCLPAHLHVGLITKDTLSRSASDWAQGGIAAAIAPEDSPILHIEDTLRAGAGLCEPEAVQLLVEQAADCIQALVQMGVAFDRQGADLALTLEAAHSRRRVLHAADTTGRAVITTLVEQVLSRPNIQVLSETFVLDVWMEQGQCRGVSFLRQGRLHWVRSKGVIMATGGGGQVFAQTTNPASSTGDGVAMGWRSGAQLRDLEFVQFHPTALTKPGAPRFLISEAVRGEGAHLIDDQGQRFAFHYHPDGELAPRDVVSRAIFNHLQKTSADPAAAHVWLDLRPIPADKIQHRFPNIIRVCQQWGVDVFREPVPVAPAAHYWMGGITTDTQARTSVAGLYAIGESASTGVHGANRLASNSLLECLVFGAQLRAIEQTLPFQEFPDPSLPPGPGQEIILDSCHSQQQQLEQWHQELPRLMWQSAGICREQASLDRALEQVKTWRQAFAALPLSEILMASLASPASLRLLKQRENGQPSQMDALVRLWGETRNLLDIAELILVSAAFRTESRGGHYRSDYPHSQPDWAVHTLMQHQTVTRSTPPALP